ncbi:MAG: sorbosone dehydrogenase family protein [Rhodothermia bacterium]|nr:MAG: sorbosone dehydrogenase family protein [Rhodothermia bacterium]
MRSVLAILIGAFLSLSIACDSGPKDIIDMDDDPVERDNNRDKDLDKITLPPGFRIDLYANNVPNARSLARSENGVVFVGTRVGTVYAVVDSNDDCVADTTIVIDEDLRRPNGVAIRNGDLYVAENSRILRYDQIEISLSQPPTPVVVYDGLPTDALHGWKFIAFGPDDKLYVPIGAPCNICDKGQPYAALWRMNTDGSNFELYASGIRNTVGFGWHPVTEELWFTDNQRDYLGDDVPSDELNYAPVPGLHFGYPYFHAGDVPDPVFGQGRNASDYRAPAVRLGPHVAPLGLEFYDGDMFPAEYRHQIFIAEHGSWNRSQKIGYRITLVRLNGSSEVISYETFADGWLQGQSNWGRPVDLEHLPDGSLLVSDDQKGVIYRISYTGS